MARQTISVIDDDDAVRDSLKVILEIWGYSVVAFASCREFLAAGQGLRPDCLVLDVHMPEMNGPDLVRRLRAEGNAVPVVLITGRRDDTLGEQVRQIGAVLLDKPVAHSALRHTLEDCLGSSAQG